MNDFKNFRPLRFFRKLFFIGDDLEEINISENSNSFVKKGSISQYLFKIS